MKMKLPKYLWIRPPTTLPTPVTENTSLIWKNNNECKQTVLVSKVELSTDKQDTYWAFFYESAYFKLRNKMHKKYSYEITK